MFKKVVISAMLLASASSAMAIEVTGKITELWVNDNTLQNGAYIALDNTYVTACNTNQSKYMVIDFTAPGMKEAYAMALAAFMSDRTITIASGGVCDGVNEKVRYLYMKK
jgi:hypothetical protein